ncbi:MAG TPA: type II toxin-antitoxin system VapC family toxin [Longimicrobium sp.]|jgi:tRNA(fMet)-specific endonuclease VapC
MAGEVLLDTSVIVAYFRGDTAVQRVFGSAGRVFVPSIAMGELFLGAERSNQREAKLAQAEAFAAGTTVLACDLETARQYGEIQHQLRRKGRPIPENDVWIAAIAQQHELPVATRDAHFQEIEDLDLLAW